MITLNYDLRPVLVECKGNYQLVIDEINKHAPKGLKGDSRFIGNCLYTLATEYCVDTSVEIGERIAFQEFLFDNYRVNGILGDNTDISRFNE